MIQKTFGLSNHDLMYGDSWINMTMKMRDMPYYSYRKGKKESDSAKEGSLDILKEKFGKYMEK